MEGRQRATPSAAVVITNYNYGRFVTAAIRSALQQTVPCQIIVVDDGSTDDSRIGIDELARRHPGRVTVIPKANGGQASAFNAGWAEVDAPLVFFLDGDDLLDPTAVERVAERLTEEPDLARCQFRLRWIDERGSPIPGGFPESHRRLPAGDLRARIGRNPDDIAWQPTSGGAFASAVLRHLLPMPEEPYRISADHYLSNVAALHGPIGAIESELGGYRVHGDNADHRSGFDVTRARQILIRTEETHRLLIEHGRRLGVAMPSSPDGFRSLTTTGLRLTSLRLNGPAPAPSSPAPVGTGPADTGPANASPVDTASVGVDGGHPFPGDRRSALARKGLVAAWNRSDFSPAKRMLAMGWIGLMAIVPRPLVRPLAARALTR